MLAALAFLLTFGTRMLRSLPLLARPWARSLSSLLAALALLSVPALAQAEEPTKSYPDCGREPTDAEVLAAKGAFDAGNASFNEADYSRAIDYWEDAFRRDCTANPLLLNLARAYELAGRKRQAVVALETYIARRPSSGEKDQINRRVEVLKTKIAEEDAAAAAAPTTANGGTTPTTTGPTTTTPMEQPAPRAKRSAGPWIVMGIGGAATVVGAIGYFSSKQKMDEANARCDNPNTTQVEDRTKCFDNSAVDEGNDARKNVTLSGAVFFVGVGAVAGGAIWWYLDGKRVANAQTSVRRRTAIVPLLSPELAGLSVSGSF
jgi:tetratricopeptide (TPR) repeat protein